MARIIIELTNSCNLRCRHCFDERHAATSVLPPAVLDHVLAEGHDCGIDLVCFTGGEPTVHPDFDAIVDRACAAGYDYSFVSNGINFRKVSPLLVRQREGFRGVTFSCDGAREATHDRMRGQGSFRRLMQAATLCVFNELTFTFNMVVNADNVDEIEEMVRMTEKLGAAGVRFGHLMPTAETFARGLELGPDGSRAAQARIERAGEQAAVAVVLAPGFFSEIPLYPCGPLEGEEYNVDCRGRLTLCCQLSGQAGPERADDTVADLNRVGLRQGIEAFRGRVAAYLRDKRARIDSGTLGPLDRFPCWYCAKVNGKTAPLLQLQGHPWMDRDGETR